MHSARLTFALERLTTGDWARFERFASQFLAPDFQQLRTVASASGDLGRDSELFSPDGDPTVVLQYSVRQDWRRKISETLKRVQTTFKNVSVIVYVTNQTIGANADTLKKELRTKHKIILDILDRNWFLDRFQTDDCRLRVSEELALDVVDSYLSGHGVIEARSPALSEYESKAAVLHIQLQWEDDSREKGLTKISYEALVKSVMRETSSEKRMSRIEVCEAVWKLLPNRGKEAVFYQVETAIDRMAKKTVRVWPKSSEVCLTHDQVVEVRQGLAERELKDKALNELLEVALKGYVTGSMTTDSLSNLVKRSRRVLDNYLLQKGEEFADAVSKEVSIQAGDDFLEAITSADFTQYPDESGLRGEAVAAVRFAVIELLQRSDAAMQEYLREIADSYTLFAFLRAVPDVQKAMQKVFSDGHIWLDTSVLLPVLAETLLDTDEQVLTRLLKIASDAGIKLRVTAGVVQELERHINRCLAYLRTPRNDWVGGVPFLYAMHQLSVGSSFEQWIESFCGKERPVDDLVDYLSEVISVEVENLSNLLDSVDTTIRWEVDRIWREAHEARRKHSVLEFDSFVVDRLIQHDVECFLGVVAKRTGAKTSELGYGYWWLTFDKTVKTIGAKLKESLGATAPKAPVMSPDFLANYLAVGPIRSRLSKAAEAALPVVTANLLPGHVPKELVEVASAFRKEHSMVNERILRRTLRDCLDKCKQQAGAMSVGGFHQIRQQLEAALLRKVAARR